MRLPFEAFHTAAWGAGVVVTGYLLVTLFIVPFFSPKSKYLDSHVCVGRKKQWFSRFRADLASVIRSPALVLEGYEKVEAVTFDARCTTDSMLVLQGGQELGHASILR
jgi:hypothetical protein